MITGTIVSTWQMVQQQRLNRELIEAVKRKDAQGVVALLQQGADANSEEMYQGQQKPLWREFLDRVLHRSPTTDAPGRAALIVTLTTAGTELHPIQSGAVFKALLDHGADPNVSFGIDNVLTSAIMTDLPDQVHLLLERGADISTVPADEIIQSAIEQDDPAIIADLVDHGVDLHPRGCSLLLYAVQDDRPDVVRLLLERHIDVNEGIGGLTPLIAAESINTPQGRQIVKMLKAAGAKEYKGVGR